MIILNVFDWIACNIFVLDGLLQPHSSILKVHIGFSMVLYSSRFTLAVTPVTRLPSLTVTPPLLVHRQVVAQYATWRGRVVVLVLLFVRVTGGFIDSFQLFCGAECYHSTLESTSSWMFPSGFSKFSLSLNIFPFDNRVNRETFVFFILEWFPCVWILWNRVFRILYFGVIPLCMNFME